jgi:hypothetical protein
MELAERVVYTAARRSILYDDVIMILDWVKGKDKGTTENLLLSFYILWVR